MKVLVVEDSRRPQTSPAVGLIQLGYDVDVASDGVQAIAYASRHDYDIIILDLVLPKESSLLVLHEIRESDREVEILLLSSRDQIHDRVTALIQGADDYLVKPFSFDELHEHIQSLVQRKTNQITRQNMPADKIDASAHLNRLIENLLKLCRHNHDEIELVISEIKLTDLLERVCSDLRDAFVERDIALKLPVGKLPTLLVDAKWMEHLLTNLLTNAITHSPSGSEIEIKLQANTDYCALEIENPMQESLTSDEFKTMVKNFCNQDLAAKTNEPLARLSLVKSYADCMNLQLNALIVDDNLLRICLSSIKLV